VGAVAAQQPRVAEVEDNRQLPTQPAQVPKVEIATMEIEAVDNGRPLAHKIEKLSRPWEVEVLDPELAVNPSTRFSHEGEQFSRDRCPGHPAFQ
jgi:hypothetical protein